MNLNEEQNAAINAGTGAWCCLAAPGSGKTLVLTERVRRLFREGVSPSDLVALTFTVESASEMARRVGVPFSKLERGGFRTFHSLCLRIVSDERRYLPFGLSSEPIPQPQVLSKLLSVAMKSSNIPKKEFQAVRAYISYQKRKRIDPEQAQNNLLIGESGVYADVYGKYEESLHGGGMLDFDDLILWAVWILEEYSAVLDRWQYRYVLADEAQDTDDLQFRLLQLISKKHGNVFCVGDFSQALYGFRGAHPENLLNFEKWFPGAKTLILPMNYRSSEPIVKFVKAIAPIENDLTKAMRSRGEQGPEVEFKMYGTPSGEAEDVVAKSLTNPASCAILARTNAQISELETVCTENDVKYRLLGKSGYWRTAEIQNLVGLCGFALSSAEPKTYSQELITPNRVTLRSVTAKEGVQNIIKLARLEAVYADTDFEDDQNFALANIRKAVQIAERFETLAEFITHARKAFHAAKRRPNALTLGTIHSSKGLEFTNVFLIGVQDGMLPHKRGEIEEERRIFYVGASRAAKRLQISFVGTPSPFLEKFLTPEIKTELQKNSSTIEKIERQQKLFAEVYDGGPVHQ